MNNYKIGSENWNNIASSHSYRYVNETSRMVLIKVTYGLDSGSKHKTANQLILNEDNDTGIIKGSK